jgi:hypothetical protein
MIPTTTTRFLAAALPLIFAACSPHPSSDASAATPAASAPAVSASSATSVSAPVGASDDERDEANENGGNPASKLAPASPSDATTRGPRIKGIGLGDSPDDVHKALVALLPVGGPCQVSPDAARVVCDGIAQQLQGSFTFESGHLSGYKFYSYLSSLAFGRMPFKDFTQNFMDAYGIPRMDPAQDNPMFSQYLRYRDASGWETGIYPDNTFYLKAIATATQQAKSFN